MPHTIVPIERKYLAQLEPLLEITADNECAVRLYEKLGFVHEARKNNAVRFEGVYHDAVRMCLLQP